MSLEKQILSFLHDGLSKHNRALAALQPGYFQVDEQSIADLLRFAQELSRKIQYFNDHNQVNGNWEEFLRGDPIEMVRFLQHPAAFDAFPEKKERYSRPHLTLFLAFLKLFQHNRHAFNELPQRHLDHYYRDILQLKAKPPVADHVHLLLPLSTRYTQQALPAGALLSAGADNEGNPIEYVTDKPMVVNQAQVAQVLHLCQDKNGQLLQDVAPAILLDPETPNEGWPTFGNPDTMPSARTGMAIASPLLFLSAGTTRTITLTLTVTNLDASRFKTKNKVGQDQDIPTNDLLQLALSTTEEFVPIIFSKDDTPTLDQGAKTIAIKIPLDAKFPAIALLAAPQPGLPAPPWPMLQLIWKKMPNLKIKTIMLQVEAAGLKPAWLQNNQGRIDPKKPFPPFGAEPLLDNPLKIGHPELAVKPLRSIAVNLDWAGAPTDEEMTAIYQPYQTIAKNEASPTYNLDSSKVGNVLLRLDDPNNGQTIQIASGKRFYKLKEANTEKLTYSTYPSPVRHPSQWTKDFFDTYRHLTLQLADEGMLAEKYNLLVHKLRTLKAKEQEKLLQQAAQYQAKVTQTVTPIMDPLDKTKEIGKSYDYSINQQNTTEEATGPALPDSLAPPVAPMLKDLSINYTTQVSSAKASEQLYLHIYPLHPNGYAGPEDFKDIEGLDWTMPLQPPYSHDGELYIGITQARPPQNLSVLFQIVEGSMAPDAMAAQLEWSYLSRDDQWRTAPPGDGKTPLVLFDDTNSLLDSGIMRFAIPEDAELESRLFPPGLLWLRAVIKPAEKRGSSLPFGIGMNLPDFDRLFDGPNTPPITRAVGDLLGIHTQAVRASLKDNTNAAAHYEKPLPAGTLKELAKPLPGLSAVLQPYASFGGRAPEDEAHYYTRVSERLRHKNRALTPWDYERLVLEHFPGIYKVKCAPFDKNGKERLGYVTVVVIPDRRNTHPTDPFHPKASISELKAIQAFLAQHTPPFTTLEVVNPVYETVQLEFDVKFMPGCDKGYYKAQLQQDLIRYLSPWAYDMGADIIFDQTIYQGGVIYFIQQLPYVEYVADLGMYRLTEDDDPSGPFPEMASDNPRSVWVSDKQHLITVIDKEIPDSGIGTMRIEYDFAVHPKPGETTTS